VGYNSVADNKGLSLFV